MHVRGSQADLFDGFCTMVGHSGRKMGPQGALMGDSTFMARKERHILVLFLRVEVTRLMMSLIVFGNFSPV